MPPAKLDDIPFIPDLPSDENPLSSYRRNATFDWKQLRVYFESEESLRIKYDVWNRLENEPLFQRSSTTPSVDDQKKLAALRMKRVAELRLLPEDIKNSSYQKRSKFMMTQNEAFHEFCPSLSAKLAISSLLFSNAVICLGSGRHRKVYNAAMNGEIVTAIAITEVSHGSNTKQIGTTATYDKSTKEFVINTPNFETAKVLVGNLGKTASTILLFANLITSDGENRGIHGFLVPVRDTKTLKPLGRIVIKDVGEKIGLNGMDNGFVMFDSYRIPKENLLNRTADVNDNGQYESVFSEPSKILGAALESLFDARIGIINHSTNSVAHAVVIAVRYAAVRKQFGPIRNGDEVSIIEYPLHQWRLFPYLASACVFKVTANLLSDVYMDTVERVQSKKNGFLLLAKSVAELHALISCSKAMFTWVTSSAIQEARECCGGHGYLKSSNIGELRNDHDPALTYEGDNNVLVQQASNWLLKQWNGSLQSPLGTVGFFSRKGEIMKSSFKSFKKLSTADFIVSCYEWLICHLLQETSKQIMTSMARGSNNFEAKNESQVYKARTLSLALAEYYAIISCKKRFESDDTPGGLNSVLDLVFAIYGFWSIDKHMATFYIGGFADGPEFSDFVRSSLIKSCEEIKSSAVAIADALSPPDFVLNSVIGKSDGKLYENLKEEFFNSQGSAATPTWAKEVVVGKEFEKMSKEIL